MKSLTLFNGNHSILLLIYKRLIGASHLKHYKIIKIFQTLDGKNKLWGMLWYAIKNSTTFHKIQAVNFTIERNYDHVFTPFNYESPQNGSAKIELKLTINFSTQKTVQTNHQLFKRNHKYNVSESFFYDGFGAIFH